MQKDTGMGCLDIRCDFWKLTRHEFFRTKMEKNAEKKKKMREEICNLANSGYGMKHAEIVCRRKPELA
ncbi:MAG: hypothetical protein J5654_12730 [Victivallales bacterium]|nr:hypothetical protein [Victivallales bacterium]